MPGLAADSAAVSAALVAALLAAACSTPSSEIDGGDLLGVFDRDAGAADARPSDAGRADGGRPREAGAAAPSAAPAADAGAVTPRPPGEGACLEAQGTPLRDVHRTLGRPPCRDAQILEWRDGDGSPRYACVFAPKGVETRAPLPLVVFFHDAEDDPTSVDKKTNLRKLGARFDLSGDPAHAGFVVLAPQGRALKGKHGSVFDTDYVGPGHVDLATVDHFIDELADRRLLDRRRLYTLGAGEGGRIAAAYAMQRADRIAAFAAYGSDGPAPAWSCQGPPTPAMVVYRACDSIVPCESVERWLRARDALGAETAWLRLGAALEEEPSCAVRNKCKKLKGESHHRRWPKGREEDALRFFARHVLGVDP